MSTPCFFLTPTTKYRRHLRRYKVMGLPVVPVKFYQECPLHGYHDSRVAIEDAFVETTTDTLPAEELPHDDPRWPADCECGYVFADDDMWQVFSERVYVDLTTDRAALIGNAAPVGAMWYADWMKPLYEGPDGHVLMVMSPGGVFVCDSQASNCSKPDDKKHKCWVRHGVPPNITLDKNGDTCNAGSGSILINGWHGFLRNGVLID